MSSRIGRISVRTIVEVRVIRSCDLKDGRSQAIGRKEQQNHGEGRSGDTLKCISFRHSWLPINTFGINDASTVPMRKIKELQ
jgi:hypothetical protein